MAAKKSRTPSPEPKQIVCSECGLPWEKHGDTPTLETCIGLLRAELAARPRYYQNATASTLSYFPFGAIQ